MTELHKCPSYYDDDNVLQDCACGRCGTNPDTSKETTPKTLEERQIDFTSKFQHRFSEIARWADKGMDKKYGKGLAHLQIDIEKYITQTHKDTLLEVIGECEKERGIHQHIIDTHDVCPRNWHEGQIEAFTTLINRLSEKVNQI